MSDRIIETPANERVTIIKDDAPRSSGGGIIVALIALVVIAAVAFWAINSSANRSSPSDASISAAADKVGTAAQKVGNAAEDAVKKID